MTIVGSLTISPTHSQFSLPVPPPSTFTRYAYALRLYGTVSLLMVVKTEDISAELNPDVPTSRLALSHARTPHGFEGSCHHRLQVFVSLPQQRGEALVRELATLARALAHTLAPERRVRQHGRLVRWALRCGPTRGLGGLQGGAPAHEPLGPRLMIRCR